MFNYYCRIAALANEYEKDGKVDKSMKLKEILKNQNRCKNCGTDLADSDEIDSYEKFICIECSMS